MLRLNNIKTGADKKAVAEYSNTTNVKVKHYIRFYEKDMKKHSNTTNVKVKRTEKKQAIINDTDSNTTNVKVKRKLEKFIWTVAWIQIQPMLRLNIRKTDLYRGVHR